MLKGSTCVDGSPIGGLHKTSRKRVVRVCDECGREDTVLFVHLNFGRERRGESKDYCRHCSYKHPYPKEPVEDMGVPGPRSKRTLPVKLRSGGYLQVRDEDGNFVDEHRRVAEASVGRPLVSGECVHHLDGDKRNNALDNLYVCSAAEHEGLHKQLQLLAQHLVRAGKIRFNNRSGSYYLDPSLELEILPRGLYFRNVKIRQAANCCFSRTDVSTESEVVRGVYRPVPILSANMSTVTDASFCISLYELGALGVLHRAWPPRREEDYFQEVRKVAKCCDWVAASIGVKAGQFELARELIRAGANIIFIDVAHGYSPYVLELGKKIKTEYPTIKLVLGNTTNVDMAYEVYAFADALKVGIGSGAACTTKNTAGCYEPQFSAVWKFKEAARKLELPIISDGGMREPADLPKAIGAGANSVMVGSILAACPESAAPTIDGKKVYAGMSSEWVQARWRGGLKPGTCAEGKVLCLDVGPPVSQVIETFSAALRSGITYAGATDVRSFQEKVEFITI